MDQGFPIRPRGKKWSTWTSICRKLTHTIFSCAITRVMDLHFHPGCRWHWDLHIRKKYHRHHGSEPAGLAPRVYTQPLYLSHPQLFVTKITAEKPPKVPLKGLPSVAISQAPDDPAQQCSGRDPGAANREQYKTSDFQGFYMILLARKLGHKVKKSSNRRQLW